MARRELRGARVRAVPRGLIGNPRTRQKIRPSEGSNRWIRGSRKRNPTQGDRNQMLNRKTWLVVAALTLSFFVATSAATAQNSQPCFTLASLEGSFAIVGTYGANVAIALGKRTLDGQGNLTATFLVNKPTPGSTTGDRTIVTGTQAGTYTVNC